MSNSYHFMVVGCTAAEANLLLQHADQRTPIISLYMYKPAEAVERTR